jgi:hypothetical protein
MSAFNSALAVSTAIKNDMYSYGTMNMSNGSSYSTLSTIAIALTASTIGTSDTTLTITGGSITVPDGVINIASGSIVITAGAGVSYPATKTISSGSLVVSTTKTNVGKTLTLSSGTISIASATSITDNFRNAVLVFTGIQFSNSELHISGKTIVDTMHANSAINCGPNALSTAGMGVAKYIESSSATVDLTTAANAKYAIVIVKNTGASGNISVTRAATTNVPVASGAVAMFMQDTANSVAGTPVFVKVNEQSQSS